MSAADMAQKIRDGVIVLVPRAVPGRERLTDTEIGAWRIAGYELAWLPDGRAAWVLREVAHQCGLFLPLSQS